VSMLRIANRDARRLWLDAQGLAPAPTGALDVLAIIKALGFVQLDTIRNVTRAHHHILWSRNQNYREPMLGRHLARDRTVFEHFTHDASVLPMEFYPMWVRQFDRMRRKVENSAYYGPAHDENARAEIRARIEAEGPLSTHDFDTKIEGEREMWSRPPHKRTLDYLWLCGELATSHRENFTKFYDLSERVIPDHLRAIGHEDEIQIDWLCREALDRLAFGTTGEIQRFWDAVDLQDVKAWAEGNRKRLVPVEIETADGAWISAFAAPDIESRLTAAAAATTRLRIVNPFDPAVRDRNRALKLLGFDYRNEIFVPAANRRWGYYVYPLLEGDRFVGRTEIKANRNAGYIDVTRLWPEPGVKWTTNRQAKFEAELARMARFIGVGEIRHSHLSDKRDG